MPIQLDLPAELEAAVRKEADRQRMTLDQFVTWALIARLPDDACPEVIRGLFRQFCEQRQAASADAGEELDFDELVKNMNASRAGGRLPFPPELKGVTW